MITLVTRTMSSPFSNFRGYDVRHSGWPACRDRTSIRPLPNPCAEERLLPSEARTLNRLRSILFNELSEQPLNHRLESTGRARKS